MGDFSKLPYDEWGGLGIEDISKECVELCKNDWDSYETSWDFKKNPLVKYRGFKNRISDAVTAWKSEVESKNIKLKALEEQLNSIFVNLYDLEGEIDTNIEESTISIAKKTEIQIIKEFILYAVGCMMGRYSLDAEGLICTCNPIDMSKYTSFIPDVVGIIPITDVDYFKDDIVSRFVEFVKVCFGEEYLEENLSYIAGVLEVQGNTSRDIIRNYFVLEFYKDNCNMYSVTGSGKRPIYWLFDSGKQNGFKCLIYMHRYNKDTLNLIRSEYLHKTQNAVENALKNAEYIIQTSASAVERAKATKDRDRYVKQLNEMRIYYQALSHLALQKIEIDLDDGVKHNYQLFQNIEVIVDGGKKQKVDLLAKI